MYRSFVRFIAIKFNEGNVKKNPGVLGKTRMGVEKFPAPEEPGAGRIDGAN